MRNTPNSFRFGALLLLLVALGLLGCSADAKRARHLKRADDYFQKGQYIKAEIEYRNAGRLSKTPDPHLFDRIATIYYEQGRLLEAFPVLKKAVDLNPDDVELRHRLGVVWLTLRSYTNANAAALFVLQGNPAHHEAKLLLADAARKPDEIAAARKKIDEIVKGSGESWSTHVALAQLALREQNLDLAEKEVESAARLDAKAPLVNLTRAQIATARKKPEEAERLLPIIVENSPPRSPNRLLLAQSKMQSTNLPQARAYVEQVLKDAPDYVPAWVLRCRIALAEKDYSECTSIAKKVLAWNPNSYDIHVLNARALLLQGNVTNAIQEFDKILTVYDTPEAKYESAVAYVQAGNTQEALKRLDELARAYPDYTEAVVLRAELKLRTGAPQEAVDALIAFSKKHPEVASDDLTLAHAYRVQGRPDDALAIYRSLIRSNPSLAELWYLEGVTYLELKKPDQARGSFEQALNLSPTYVLAAEQLVDIDLAKKNFDAAQRRADEMLKLTTNSPGALLLQAKICFARRDWPGAESALVQVIKAQPDGMLAYSLLANVYLSTGNPNKALAQLQSAVDRNPKETAAWMLMGAIHSAAREYGKAKNAYEAVLKVNPQSPGALNDLAYLLSERLNQVDEALPHAAKARELAPNDPGVGDTFAWILYRRGEVSRALPLLRECAAKMPRQPEVQYHAAMAHYSSGDEAAARASFATVTELDKTFAESRGVSRKLAVLNLDVTQPNAVETLETALKEDPKDSIAALKLGQAYERAGQNEKARAAAERAAKLNPASAQPLILLSSLNAKLNDFPKALEAGRAARKLAPNDPVLAGTLGRVSYRSHDYAAALNLLQEYARSQAADADALYDLALAFYSVGQSQDARANFQTYVSAARGTRIQDARNVIVLIDYSEGKGDPRRAETIAAERVQRDAHDLPGLMTLGLVSRASGKHSDAVRKFEQIVAIDKLLLGAQRQLAILYAGPAQDVQKAYEYGSKARQAFPNDPELTIAMGKASYSRNDFPAAIRFLKDGVTQQTDPEALFFLGMAYHKTGKMSDAKTNLNKAISGGGLAPNHAAEATKVLASLK